MDQLIENATQQGKKIFIDHAQQQVDIALHTYWTWRYVREILNFFPKFLKNTTSEKEIDENWVVVDKEIIALPAANHLDIKMDPNPLDVAKTLNVKLSESPILVKIVFNLSREDCTWYIETAKFEGKDVHIPEAFSIRLADILHQAIDRKKMTQSSRGWFYELDRPVYQIIMN